MKKLEITEEYLYKRLIKLFIDRKVYQDESYNYYKFFRKGDIISDTDCTDEYEVLQTGIFKKMTVFTYDNDGNLQYPNGSKYVWYCSLQDIDFLIPKDEKEFDGLFANIMFLAGMQEK